MSAAQRDALLDLHREAMTTNADAIAGRVPWIVADTADDAFREALYAIEVQA